MIPLLDLREQYQSIKEEVDIRLQEILESGKFILGKQVSKLEEEIANFFVSKEFEVLKVDELFGNQFEQNIHYMYNHILNQAKASKVKNLLTIRSFWDTVEVYAQVHKKRDEITLDEYNQIMRFYKTVHPYLHVPVFSPCCQGREHCLYTVTLIGLG